MTNIENNTRQNQSNKKWYNNIVLIVLIIVAINVLAAFFYTRIDLTADRRYTTTDATIHLLENMEDKISITIFLTGEKMPAAFQRLSKSTEEIIQNFSRTSKSKIAYHFEDPQSDDTTVYDKIVNYRMQGIPVTVSAGKKGVEQFMVFPWILVENRNNGKALPVFLQENNSPNLSRTSLNKSEMLLEYNIANAINQVTKKSNETIAFLTGNDEEIGINIISALGALGTYYALDTLNLQSADTIPQHYNALIVNRPMTEFSETDKYKIDRYLVNGGSVLMCINLATGVLDSFQQTGSFNSMPVDLKLSDVLFQYGLRINPNIVADAVDHEFIPLSSSGKAEESMMYSWVYYPVLQSVGNHPISKNLDGVLGRFVSSIDINENNPEITKTLLLQTSKYAKTIPVPTPLTLTAAIEEINTDLFNKSHIPVAVLLEGNFTSAFNSRKPEEVTEMLAQKNLKHIDKTDKSGKLIVISDGDIFSNEFNGPNPLDIGQYKFGNYTYDNKSFLLNCMAYLTNDNNLLEARSKSFISRILDPKRVEKERTQWQFVNIGVPAILIVIFGIVFFFIRNNKYGKSKR